MELRDVKRHMNRMVQYSGSAYELTAIIFRRDRKTGGDFYQAELTERRRASAQSQSDGCFVLLSRRAAGCEKKT